MLPQKYHGQHGYVLFTWLAHVKMRLNRRDYTFIVQVKRVAEGLHEAINDFVFVIFFLYYQPLWLVAVVMS